MGLLKLFTPGPLETKPRIKNAMLKDIGSRDDELINITKRVRESFLRIACAGSNYTCIPLQGSGTFGMEAAIDTFIPQDSKSIVLVNGIYGDRIVKILEKTNKKIRVLRIESSKVPNIDDLETLVRKDEELTHAIFVHCETTTGIVNPVNKLIKLFHRYNIVTLIDSISAFGALDVDSTVTDFDVLVTSSNKCLESVPGVSITLAKTELVQNSKYNANSFSLDLYEQWRLLECKGQWRFTPPTHVLQALDCALILLIEETVQGRYARYSKNKKIVVDGLKKVGIETIIEEKNQSPICLAFSVKNIDCKFDFDDFYQKLKDNNILIYHTMDEFTLTFRIGCIGNLTTHDFIHLTATISEIINGYRVESFESKLAATELVEEIA